MSFDRKYFRIRQAVNGQITRRIFEYDTEDDATACAAANYFAGAAGGTVSENLGVEMGDIIEITQWASLPNANPKHGVLDAASYKGVNDVYKDDAAPSSRFSMMVTARDTDETSANYGDVTATAL